MRAKLLSLVDLTCLNDPTTQSDIVALCKKAQNDVGSVAAVCVYSEYVALARALVFDLNVKLATVVNFPKGGDSIGVVMRDTQMALQNGADEIDVVLPYNKLHDRGFIRDFLFAARQAASSHTLKVIIESGQLTQRDIILACECVIESGADFIKTSTGKVATGATLDCVNAILSVIKTSPETGLKISGGVRCYADALSYYRLVESVMGEAFCQSKTLRFGASRLVDDFVLT